MNHYYQSIKGWFSFKQVYEEAVRDAPNPAHFVEVGSYKGRSASFMAVEIINSGKKIRFDCVDTWQGSEGNQKLEPEHVAGVMYDVFLNNTSPVKDSLIAFRCSSVEGAKLYADNSLDFVFIDADHKYQHVVDDLKAWWPKVKPGGVFAGDDFHGAGVKKAVEEMFGIGGVEDITGTGTGRQWRIRKRSRFRMIP